VRRPLEGGATAWPPPQRIRAPLTRLRSPDAPPPSFPSVFSLRLHLRARLAASHPAGLPLPLPFPPTPEELALRARCAALLEKTRTAMSTLQDEIARPVRVRLSSDAATAATRSHQLAAVKEILCELQDSSEALHALTALPLAQLLAALLPAGPPAANEPLVFDAVELESPQLLAPDVACIYEYVTERLGEYAAERGEEGALTEGMEDVDLFSVEDNAAPDGEAGGEALACLTVHPKWLTHLGQRAMGEGGRICRVTATGLECEEAAVAPVAGTPAAVVNPCVDDVKGGLVLDWVYGKIVNTAEKARSGAQTALGQSAQSLAPDELCTAVQATWEVALRAVREHGALGERRTEGKALLAEVVRARVDAEAQGARSSGGGGAAEASVSAVRAVVALERALAAVKSALLAADAGAAGAVAAAAQGRVARGHPQYRRLQEELAEIEKAAAAASAGAGGSAQAAEAAQLADERQQLFTELKARGSALNAAVEAREASRLAEATAAAELQQLQGWRAALHQLSEDLGGEEAVREGALKRFHADVRPRLYSAEADRALFEALKARLKDCARRMELCAVALYHCELRLANLCAVDPGAQLGAHLVLPLLQQRIFRAAEQRAAQAAEEAEAAMARSSDAARQAKAAADAAQRRKRDAAAAKAAAQRTKKAALANGTQGAIGVHGRASSPDDVQSQSEVALQHAAKLAARRAALDAELEARRQQLMAEGGHWAVRCEAIESEKAMAGASDDEWREARLAVEQAEAAERSAVAVAASVTSSDGGAPEVEAESVAVLEAPTPAMKPPASPRQLSAAAAPFPTPLSLIAAPVFSGAALASLKDAARAELSAALAAVSAAAACCDALPPAEALAAREVRDALCALSRAQAVLV